MAASHPTLVDRERSISRPIIIVVDIEFNFWEVYGADPFGRIQNERSFPLALVPGLSSRDDMASHNLSKFMPWHSSSQAIENILSADDEARRATLEAKWKASKLSELTSVCITVSCDQYDLHWR